MSKQEQKSGNNSVNVQAGEIIVQRGLSYAEIKEVALDIFKANFYELAGKAKDIARSRAEEITENFLRKLQQENPYGFSKAEDPDFQHALFIIQKEYARYGDNNLGDLLVDLLVDRSKCEQRDILQIVLSASLDTVPKLTMDQLSALAIIFLFSHTDDDGIRNDQDLGEYFDKHVLPHVDTLNTSEACYRHLEFAGCGSIGSGGKSLESVLGTAYQGIFNEGFFSYQLAPLSITQEQYENLFSGHPRNTVKMQIRVRNKEELEKKLDTMSLSPEDKREITSYFDGGKMPRHAIREKCISLRPYMKRVFDTWEGSDMQTFILTSVGIAIGHANIRRFAGQFPPLARWIK